MFGPVSLAALYFSIRYIVDSKQHQKETTKENVGEKVQENEIISEKRLEAESGKTKSNNGNHKGSMKANHICIDQPSNIDQTGKGRSLNDIIKSEAQLSTLQNKPLHNRNNEQQKKKKRRFPFKKHKKECGTSTSERSETTIKNNVVSTSSATITPSETVGPDCSTDNQQQAHVLHEGIGNSLHLLSDSVRELVKLMKLEINLSKDESSLDACTQTYDHERPVNTKDSDNHFIDKQSLFYLEGDRMISFCLVEQDPGVVINEAFIKNSDLSEKNEAAAKRIQFN